MILTVWYRYVPTFPVIEGRVTCDCHEHEGIFTTTSTVDTREQSLTALMTMAAQFMVDKHA